jgi:PAS domain S-box-containing protein
MVWQSTPWADPLLVSTVVAATLAVFGLLYVLLVRGDRRVTAFATLMLGTAVWTLGYSFQFASADLAGKRLWATVSLVGEAIVPAAWCTFALVYARREAWLTRMRLAALWTVPALTVALAVTNANHGLVWRETATATAPGGYTVLAATPGPWMAVHGAYSYIVALAGVVLMAGLIARTRRVYRGQAAVLLAGILVPAGANLASLADLGPGATVNLTPPSVALLGVAFAVGIFKYRLFDLVLVPRSSVVENMGEGYVLLDAANEVVDLNAAARSLLDGDEGRLLGRNARRAFGVDFSVLDSFEGDPVTETVTVDEGGDQRYLDLSVSRVEAGRATGRLLAVRDVTDRVRLERRFRRLIEASSDMVFVLDETGRVDYASPSVERVLGYDPDDLVGRRSFEDLTVEDADHEQATGVEAVAEDAPSQAAATWRRVLEGTGTDPAESSRIRFEVCLETAGGEVRTIEAIARYLVEDPAVEGIVINARDVTDRVEREQELARANERLDQFVSFVSHDLRNPLNVAMGHLDLAIETGDEESLRKVKRQHQRMETMIQDLLSMAREGRDVEEEELDAVGLDAAASHAWRNVETEGATLEVTGDATMLADESRLPNLFENLFRNAVEHGSTSPPSQTPEDAVEHGAESDPAALTVRVEPLPDGFAVGDDGVGIPADVREEVTESGFTTESGNTGYGLAIVSEIATAHGWDLAVTESDAGGARFEFTGVGLVDDTGDDAERTDPGIASEQSPPGGGE